MPLLRGARIQTATATKPTAIASGHVTGTIEDRTVQLGAALQSANVSTAVRRRNAGKEKISKHADKIPQLGKR